MHGHIAMGAPTTMAGLPTVGNVVTEAELGSSSSRANETLVEVLLCPAGHIMTILTQTRVQFWSALQTVALLATVTLPKCAAVPGGDAGHKHVWNTTGRSLAVATLDRRIIFVEADIQLTNNSVVTMDRNDTQLLLANVPSRVCVGFEVQLEFGLVIGLAASSSALLVCTSSGYIVGVGWNRGRVLFTWSSSSVLQRACASPAPSGGSPTMPAPTATVTADVTTDEGSLGGKVSSFGASSSASNHRVAMGGSIVYFGHVPHLNLSTFVLADGSFGFLRSLPGSLDAPPASPSGRVHNIICSGLNVLSVAVSSTCSMVALSTAPQSNDGAILRLLPFDPDTLQVGFPEAGNDRVRRGDCLPPTWCDDMKALGGVRCMRWSADGALLVVGFRRLGAAVFHYSGVCIYASFRRFEAAGGARSLGPLLSRGGGGCLSACWDAHTHRLFCIGQDVQHFAMIPFAAVACTQDGDATASPAAGRSAVVVFNANSVSWLQLDASDEAGDLSPAWDTIECPQEYLEANYPIQHATVSGDGQHVACAGTYGALIFSRKLRRWRMFSVESQERRRSCVANLCWVTDVVVALPVRQHNGGSAPTYCVELYPRFHFNEASTLHVIRCERRPTMLRSAYCEKTCVLLVLEGTSALHMYSVEVLADNVLAPRQVGINVMKVRTITLEGSFDSPRQLHLAPVPRLYETVRRQKAAHSSGGASSAPQRSPLMPWLVVLSQQHGVICVDLNHPATHFGDDADPSTYVRLTTPQECVFRVWCGDALFHRVLPTTIPVITHDSTAGITLRWLGIAATSTTVQGETLLPRLMWTTPVAEMEDGASLPLAVLPHEGVVILATEGLDAQPFAQTAPRQRPSIRPVLYAHHVSLLVFAGLQERSDGPQDGKPNGALTFDETKVSDWHPTVDEDSAVLHTHALLLLREQGAFIGVMDYLLHLILHVDDVRKCLTRYTIRSRKHRDSIVLSSSPGVQETERRQLLLSIIQLLKRFREYHTVVVGLVRKIDMSKWRVLFDIIGAPVDLFDDCIDSGHLLEAAHLVRVVLMDAVTQHKVPILDGEPDTSTKGSPLRGTRLQVVLSQSPKPAYQLQAGQNAATTAVLSPLEAAARCALRLFPIVLRRLDIALTSELFRFLSLLVVELSGGHDMIHTPPPPPPPKPPSPSLHSNTSPHVGHPETSAPAPSRWSMLWPFSASKTSGGTHPWFGSRQQDEGHDGTMHLDPTQGAVLTSVPYHPRHQGPLVLVFASRHVQDNEAAGLLISKSTATRESLELMIVQLVGQLQIFTLCALLGSLAIDVNSVIASLPWGPIGTLWAQIGEEEVPDIHTRMKLYLQKRLRIELRMAVGGVSSPQPDSCTIDQLADALDAMNGEGFTTVARTAVLTFGNALRTLLPLAAPSHS